MLKVFEEKFNIKENRQAGMRTGYGIIFLNLINLQTLLKTFLLVILICYNWKQNINQKALKNTGR